MRELRLLAFQGNLKDLKIICREVGEEVNAAGPDTGRTPVHWGAIGGHLEVVSYLLKKTQARVDSLDRELNTPLNAVIQAQDLPLSKKLSVIAVLLAHGADPLRPNIHGKTSLENLRELKNRLPDSQYYLRRGVDETLRRMKQSISTKALAAEAGDFYPAQRKSSFNMPGFDVRLSMRRGY